MKEKAPNFFLIGVSRAGTTAFSEALRKHPNIFFSTPKEIGFFNSEKLFGDKKQFQNYLNYFKNATPKHIAIGEGSVRYCESIKAIERIIAFNSKAKFILILRNPVERLLSMYYLHLLYGLEKQVDPEIAIETFKKKPCPFKDHIYLLRQRCLMHDKLKAILRLVKPDNIHIIIYDDLKSNSGNILKGTFKFLSVPLDETIELKKVKKTMIVNNGLVKKIFLVLIKINKFLKYKIKIKSIKVIKFLDFVRNIFYRFFQKRNNTRVQLSSSAIFELKCYFKKDVENLSKLLSRDLMHWVN